MKYRVITEQEAWEIIASEPSRLPLRQLTETGKRSIAEFVAGWAKHPERHNLDAWYDRATEALENALQGESAVLEMSRFDSESGNTETLSIGSDDYEWHLYIEDEQ